jgi:DHA1 family bicyclomycin/chloramphenicol resistance-like MFS transporter
MSAKAQFTWLIPYLGLLSCLGPLSNDLYVPSLSLVEAGLGTVPGRAQLTMSSLLLGFSFGCLFYGPFSDRYGRKPVLCVGLLVYAFSATQAALADSLGALVMARALQGLGASSSMVLTRAIILDRWAGEEASRAMSWVAIFTFLTPVIAPIVGGYLASSGEWQRVFWAQASAGFFCLIVTALMLPRAHRTVEIDFAESMKAYRVILSDSQALGYMLCMGLAFIGLIAFVTNSSFVFVNFFGLEPYQYGLCFSGVMLGASSGAFTNSRLVTQLGISRMIGIGTLCVATGGTLALLVAAVGGGLFALLGAILIYVFGIGFVFANSIARTMSRFRSNSGAASSLFGVNQFLIGGIVAAALTAIENPSPLPLAGSMAAAGVGCALVWWLWLVHEPRAAGEQIPG